MVVWYGYVVFVCVFVVFVDCMLVGCCMNVMLIDVVVVVGVDQLLVMYVVSVCVVCCCWCVVGDVCG